MDMKKALMFGLLAGFLVLGILAMQRAQPSPKEARIYKQIEVYSPYRLEKRIGGLSIIDERTGEKEKPSAAEVMHRFDEQNQHWGKKHLVIVEDTLIVTGENNVTVGKIHIETPKEREWIIQFYGIKATH